MAAASSVNTSRVLRARCDANIFHAVTDATELTIGEFRRLDRLGTRAVYRVCAYDDELAEVEVVHGPGLRRGQRFKFDVAAVREMVIVVAPVDSGRARNGG